MSDLVTFDFHGTPLDVLHMPDGDVGVVLKRLCAIPGVDSQAQSRRLARQAAKGARWAVTAMMAATGSDGKTYEMEVLPRRSIPIWTATLDLARVDVTKRAAVARAQDSLADVLADAFLGARGAPSASRVRADTVHALIGDGDLRGSRHFSGQCKAMIGRVAEIAGITWAKAHGELRREFGVSSYLFVRLPAYPLVREWLTAQLMNRPIRRSSGQLSLAVFDEDFEKVH